MMSDLPSNAPSPRLCHIVKWPDFDGYGFNLHADKSRPGQYIGKVDENSPADVAGLREGDRIIEVNGVNISNENHKQVVKRIKAVTNETKLLVIDSEGDRWYKDHNLVIRGDQSNIIHKTSKQEKDQSMDSPASSQKSASLKDEKVNSNSSSTHDEDNKLVAEDNKSVASSSSLQSEQSTQQQQAESREEDNVVESPGTEPMNNLNLDDDESELLPPPPPPVEEKSNPEVTLDPDLSREYDNIRFEQEKNGDGTKDHFEDNRSLSSHASSRSCEETAKADNDETTGSVHDADDLERKSPMSTTPSPPPSLNPEGGNASGKESPSLNNACSGLNLNMTAAEMRAHLASKKKFDPRKDSIDLKKKYQIIQNM